MSDKSMKAFISVWLCGGRWWWNIECGRVTKRMWCTSFFKVEPHGAYTSRSNALRAAKRALKTLGCTLEVVCCDG